MAFDDQTRRRLNTFVGGARKLLTEEFTRQLQNDYGLDPKSGDVTELDRMDHLADSRRETARLLRDTMDHYLATGSSQGKKARQEALERIVREQAFTVLNRLCALRMAEARALLIESVAKGYQSKGFQLYARLAGTALGETGEAYRSYLFSLLDEFAVDLPVLFDRFSPQGRLFPRETALLGVLELIDHADLEPLWAEDETIGWIYQYFNTPEERRQMRAESQAPRNSRELAVRNQFFTPRYVVEFLTDNTLGRIWYEMTQSVTSITDHCRYLVRRPDEVFLGPMTDPSAESPNEGCLRMAALLQSGEENDWPPFTADEESVQSMIDMAHCVNDYARHPDFGEWLEDIRDRVLIPLAYEGTSTQDIFDALFSECRAERHGGDGSLYTEAWFIAACNEVRRRALKSRETELSQEELLQQPVFVPYRPLKDPRDIRMLDPACGSMHFGLYAFDLFEQIYDEAWEMEAGDDSGNFLRSEGLKPLRENYADKAVFLREVPRLIIERNIHGIDIDPRAVQIAGLSLWLRAQKSWHDHGVKPPDRPGVTRSHVVCAEPMPGEEDMLEEFLKSLQNDRLESLIRRVLHVAENQQVRATQRMAEALCGLVRTVWNEMKLAGEAGSLLKIEESLATAIQAGKAEWEEKLPLFRITEFGLDGDASKTTYVRSVPGEEEDFWNRAEAIVVAALENYAEQAEDGGNFQRRLFAADAARGFAFIDVCRQRFDAVLMNPPFGEGPHTAKRYIARYYPSAKNDIFAAFVDEGVQRQVSCGRLGAITSRTGLFLTSFQKWRQHTLLEKSSPVLLADLGKGVLDTAVVETAAYVLETAR